MLEGLKEVDWHHLSHAYGRTHAPEAQSMRACSAVRPPEMQQVTLEPLQTTCGVCRSRMRMGHYSHRTVTTLLYTKLKGLYHPFKEIMRILVKGSGCVLVKNEVDFCTA
jgi:hypothetical protein